MGTEILTPFVPASTSSTLNSFVLTYVVLLLGIYVVWIGAFVAGILNLIRSCYYCTMTVSSIEGQP